MKNIQAESGIKIATADDKYTLLTVKMFNAINSDTVAINTNEETTPIAAHFNPNIEPTYAKIIVNIRYKICLKTSNL